MIDKIKFRKTEAILYNYKELVLEIAAIELEIKEIRNDYKGCGAIEYKERVQGSNGFNSSVENEVVAKDKVIEILERRLQFKKITKEKIDIAIDAMNDTERKLVELRYKSRDPLTWDQIGYVIKFNPDYCRQKLRKKIINRIANMLFVNPYKQEKFNV